MTDIVQKLWGFCHTLRHDGIDYGDYIEQITYLLFLKMADERDVELPEGLRLADDSARAAPTSLDHYIDVAPHAGQAAWHPRRHLQRGAVAVQQPGQPEAAHHPHRRRPNGPRSAWT